MKQRINRDSVAIATFIVMTIFAVLGPNEHF